MILQLATHGDYFATALLAQQLPPLPKFSGESSDGESEIKTFQEWLDQFEMVADVCNWSLQARLVNLITRLCGQAYAFFRSCTVEQRTNYSLLVAELQKRFTPVYLPTEHSSLFHDKKQGLTETVDQYAQQLRCLFNKAYPSIQQGTKEAETFGQTVLVNQFVAGLLPAIKSKLVGIEGDFSHLLTKARFEEAKLQHLDLIQPTIPVCANKVLSNSRSSVIIMSMSLLLDHRDQALGLELDLDVIIVGHHHIYLSNALILLSRGFQRLLYVDHPKLAVPIVLKKSRPASNVVSNVTPIDDDTNISKLTVNTHLNSNNVEVNDALDSVIAQMHGITSSSSTDNVQLGPVLTAEIAVEGEIIEALLDTGSPVTIIQLEALLEILARQRCPDQAISEWRTVTESRLEPTSLILKNYSGDHDNLKIVRQIRVIMSRPGYSISAVIQVQSGAPAKLLVGTDLLSQLRYFLCKHQKMTMI